MNEKVKDLINSLGVVQGVNIIVKNFKIIAIVFAPLVFVYLLFYLGLIVGSFIIWKFPEVIPIPFVGGRVHTIGDRLLVVAGFILLFLKVVSDKNI